MEFSTYDSKVREINHYKNQWGEEYTIVNQAHWFKGKLTDERAIEKWEEIKKEKRI